MLKFALALHVNSHVDSALASTREFWRRKLGLPEEIVTDPRPLAEIAASVQPPPVSNVVPRMQAAWSDCGETVDPNKARVSFAFETEEKLFAALAALREVCGWEDDTDDLPAPVPHLSLTIGALQRAHVERQEEWCPDQKPDLSFRGNELGGECGEAQNVIKKLERERHGWRGSRDTVEHLAEELADVIHCAVLVAITAGIEIEPAVVAKFNSTSEKNGLSTFLATTEGSEE